MIRRRSSRSSTARHRAAASPAPCRESGAHPSLTPACPPALRSVRGLKTVKGAGGHGRTDGRSGPGQVSPPPDVFTTQQRFYKGALSSRMPTERSSLIRPTNTTLYTAWHC
ncbi:transmembrane protein 256 isoform X2 [Nannospalax galili]|uniref:transmembrane protein 256 isoform X2 n=1 Tax=Nannospalax galili TaxID=1026970 RepID=UPI00111C62BC|nr:transmembrane protein 256 isoform X2 [Nannospalax galili]